MDLRGLADAIAAELRDRATPGRAEREKAYLKSPLEHLGTSVPAIRAVAKDVAGRHPALTHEDLVGLVDALWRRPYTSAAWPPSSCSACTAIAWVRKTCLCSGGCCARGAPGRWWTPWRPRSSGPSSNAIPS